MQRLLNQIAQVPIVGDLFYYAYYVAAWFIISPAVAILGGLERLRFGSSVFWIPKQQAQTVREGVELLRGRDPEMFSRLTNKQRLIVYYIPPEARGDRKSDRRVFLMHSRFIEWGPEGVACFIAQSLMLAAAVHHYNQCRLSEQESAALKSVSRNMAEWLTKHSFNPGLISPYQKIVKDQEERARAACTAPSPSANAP